MISTINSSISILFRGIQGLEFPLPFLFTMGRLVERSWNLEGASCFDAADVNLTIHTTSIAVGPPSGCLAFRASLMRQLMNSSEIISPCPVSSTLKTSITDVRSFLRTLQTPSSFMVAFKTAFGQRCFDVIPESLQSSSADAKLMHMLPSQVPPLFFTVPGIEVVSISSILFRIPSGVRNPTIILGTPRRNDCIQNFISFLSKLIMSLSFRISALVFNSIQLIGLSSQGFASQTKLRYRQEREVAAQEAIRTCINLTAKNHTCTTDTGFDN